MPAQQEIWPSQNSGKAVDDYIGKIKDETRSDITISYLMQRTWQLQAGMWYSVRPLIRPGGQLSGFYKQQDYDKSKARSSIGQDAFLDRC